MIERIGKYRVLERIGRGGMGVVLKAHDPVLDRTVALKVIAPDVEVTPELRTRFFREAQACARLSHPNIVTVYDLGDVDGRLFIVMQLLEGEELRQVITERRPLPLVQKLSVMLQVCDGVGYAHQRGVVHRDIKPGNIFLLRDGGVKILDFGVARITSAAGDLTQTGLIMGTLRYMAPEQARGRADHRSDIFSVGAVFYEFLAHRPAFAGDDPMEILEALRTEDPPALDLLDPEIPADLGGVVARALRKDPAQRIQDLAVMRRELEGVHRRLLEEGESARARLRGALDRLQHHGETAPGEPGGMLREDETVPILDDSPGLAALPALERPGAFSYPPSAPASSSPGESPGAGAEAGPRSFRALVAAAAGRRRGWVLTAGFVSALIIAGATVPMAFRRGESPPPPATVAAVPAPDHQVVDELRQRVALARAEAERAEAQTLAPYRAGVEAESRAAIATDRRDLAAARLALAEALAGFETAATEARASASAGDAATQRLLQRATDARIRAEAAGAADRATELWIKARTVEQRATALDAQRQRTEAQRLFAEAEALYREAEHGAGLEAARKRAGAPRPAADTARVAVATRPQQQGAPRADHVRDQAQARALQGETRSRREAAVKAGADILAKELFDVGTGKLSEGDTRARAEDWPAAVSAYREALERYSEAERRVQDIGRLRVEAATAKERREQARQAGAERLARDLFEAAASRHVEADRLARGPDVVTAIPVYREAAERYAAAERRAREAARVPEGPRL